MQAIEQKKRPLERQTIIIIWTNRRQISRESKKGMNTINFVALINIPVGHTVMYSRIVVDMQPQKEDPIRVRLTVGRNRMEYPVKVTTKMAEFNTFKIRINSVISTQGVRYAGWDIGNYYLETPMGR